MDNLSPTGFISDFVEKNKDALEKLDKNKEFMNWCEAITDNDRVNANANEYLFKLLAADEYIPGEMNDQDYVYLDNRYQRPMSSRMLRNAGKTEPARLIKNRRSLQFTEYGKVSLEQKESGLTIQFEDPEYKPTLLEKQTLKEFTFKFVNNFFFPPFTDKPNLTKFLSSAFQDWFDLDDITFEIRRSGSGMPLGFHLTDPTIVFHVLPDKNNYPRWDQDPYNLTAPPAKAIKYLIEKNGKRLAAFTDDRMMKSHFFVSSDFKEAYRGFSIMEQGIRMVLNIVNSIAHNSANFSNNRSPRGVFAFQGGQNNRVQLEQFKKLLYSYLSGASNQYRIPVLGLPEKGSAQFIPFNMTSREMEFHLWMTLLMTILCQLSGTNPEEISMASNESAMTGKKLFDQAPDGILQVSRDTGLNTFLRYFEQLINDTNVLKQMTGLNVIAKFNGLIVEDEKVKVEVIRAKLSTTASLNELITADGGKEQRLMYGDYNIYDIKGIDNPQVFSTIQANVQQEIQEKQQQEQLQQQAQQSNQPNNNISPEDQQLVNKYGEAQ